MSEVDRLLAAVLRHIDEMDIPQRLMDEAKDILISISHDSVRAEAFTAYPPSVLASAVVAYIYRRRCMLPPRRASMDSAILDRVIASLGLRLTYKDELDACRDKILRAVRKCLRDERYMDKAYREFTRLAALNHGAPLALVASAAVYTIYKRAHSSTCNISKTLMQLFNTRLQQVIEFNEETTTPP